MTDNNLFNDLFLIDKRILSDKRLTSNDTVVYFALDAAIDKKNKTRKLKYNDLSKLIGLSKTSIQKSVKHLKKNGIIECMRTRDGQYYYLNPYKKFYV